MKKTGLNRLSFRLKLLSCLLAIGILLSTLVVQSLVIAESRSGLVNVTARVDGPAPTIAATIDSPSEGENFSYSPIIVSGTCAEEGLIIIILDNGNFVGSSICGNDKRYSLQIDLQIGANQLIAQVVDSLDQYGPDSVPVNITYSKPSSPTTGTSIEPTSSQGGSGTSTPPGQSIPQLSLVLDPHYVGYTNKQAGQMLSIPLKINGGLAPYAVHIDWGDGNESLLSQATTDSFILAHTYTAGGSYKAIISATDSSGQKTMLEVLIVINGKRSSVIQNIITTKAKLPPALWLTPVFGLLLVVVGYKLGIRGLKKHGS